MLSPSPGISAFPSSPENLLNWTATIAGPSGTPYADLTFKLLFQFPANYPYAPPTVLFKTPIYHPNVDFSGRICLDILKDKWSAVYNVQSVLLSLQSLLGEPNKYFVLTPGKVSFWQRLELTSFCSSSSPLNGQAAELWDSDPAEFQRLVLARHHDLDEE